MRELKGPIIFISLILVFVLVFLFYSNDTAAEQLKIAVSIIPQKTFVKAVGGDLVDVVVMVPPGNSPGNYQPTPKEFVKFSQASLYFTIGVPAERVNILPRIRDFNNDMKVVNLYEKVAEVYEEREFAPGKRDPHIWLSPHRVKVMIDTIARQLAVLDEEHRDTYLKNAGEYINRLKGLDREIKETLIGLDNKTFIVYHPSYGYFADDYGLNMLAIEKNGKKATARRLQQIITRAKNKGIKVIFHQVEIDNKQVEALAEEIGGETVQLAPLAQEYIKNLQKTADLFRKYL